MPATQKKLTSYSTTREPLKPLNPTRKGQRKLHDLKKVVSIKGGSLNFDSAELRAAQTVLESKASTIDQLLNCLRRLSCFQITRHMLLESNIGHQVRLLKRHQHQDVARIAAALVEKWKEVVLSHKLQNQH